MFETIIILFKRMLYSSFLKHSLSFIGGYFFKSVKEFWLEKNNALKDLNLSISQLHSYRKWILHIQKNQLAPIRDFYFKKSQELQNPMGWQNRSLRIEQMYLQISSNIPNISYSATSIDFFIEKLSTLSHDLVIVIFNINKVKTSLNEIKNLCIKFNNTSETSIPLRAELNQPNPLGMYIHNVKQGLSQIYIKSNEALSAIGIAETSLRKFGEEKLPFWLKNKIIKIEAKH